LVNEFSIDIWNYLNFSKITHFDSVICWPGVNKRFAEGWKWSL
jgi:hypothetical protein